MPNTIARQESNVRRSGSSEPIGDRRQGTQRSPRWSILRGYGGRRGTVDVPDPQVSLGFSYDAVYEITAAADITFLTLYSTYAALERSKRNWLARKAWHDVRSANRPHCCSLIRFSISPRWQYTSSYNPCGSPGTFTTTNRGLAPWALCSALTITRRRRSQLDAAYENDPKSRCGWPVRRNCRSARSIQSRAWRSSTAFLARPRT